MKRLFYLSLIVLLLVTGCNAPVDKSSTESQSESTLPDTSNQQAEVEENDVLREGEDKVITVKSARGTDIYAGVMIPELGVGETCPMVILVHGFTGDMDENGLFYGDSFGIPGVGNQLAELGMASLRVNFPGTGQSTESFESYTPDNMLADLNSVYAFVMEQYPIDKQRVGILGYSMGGRMAAMFVQGHPEIETMLLWAPSAENNTMAIDWYDGMRAKASENGRVMVEQDWVDRDLYMSMDFFTEVERVTPLDYIRDFNGDKMMIVASEDTTIPASTFERLIEDTDIEYLYIMGADHDFGTWSDQPRYTKILLNTTISYLYRYLTY